MYLEWPALNDLFIFEYTSQPIAIKHIIWTSHSYEYMLKSSTKKLFPSKSDWITLKFHHWIIVDHELDGNVNEWIQLQIKAVASKIEIFSKNKYPTWNSSEICRPPQITENADTLADRWRSKETTTAKYSFSTCTNDENARNYATECNSFAY